MVDVVNKQTRSKMMSRIRRKNTKPELLLRKALHARGFRFRVDDRRLPGRPDVVLPKWRLVIQVHGCFWHRHAACDKATMPATNVDFWEAKFDANVKRDEAVIKQLLARDWSVLIVWECALGRANPAPFMDEIIDFISGRIDLAPRYREIGASKKIEV